MRKRFAFVLCVFVLNEGASAWGQETIKLAPPVKGKIANLVPVTAPSATCIALSETHGWLAFGHDKTFLDAHVSLVRLDAKGNPAAYSVPVKLPLPVAAAPLKKNNYPLSLAFHPKLPLLYVWQDFDTPMSTPVVNPPQLAQFDHLVIYNVAKEPPELVLSLLRGQEYFCGSQGGSVFVDPTGSFLYVPNIRDPKNFSMLSFGRFPLDELGLPRMDPKDAALPAPARIKKLSDLNAAKAILPPQTTPIEYINLFPFNAYGTGFSFHPVTKDIVIAGSWNGLLAWRPEDKQCLVNGLSFRHSGHKYLVHHRTLPALYAPIYNTDVFYRAEQLDGYLTQVPKGWSIPGTSLLSAPALLAKGKRLVIGGQYYVYAIDLDDRGVPQPAVVQVQLLNPAVRALAYSERYDRLYASVEVSK